MVNAREYRVLFPSKWHEPFLEAALSTVQSMLVFADASHEVIQSGLANTNNDACYSAILAAGQASRFRRAESLKSTITSPQIIVPNLCVHCRCDDMASLVERAVMANENSGGISSPFFDVINALPADVQKSVAQALLVGDIFLQAEYSVRSFLQAEEQDRLALSFNALSQEACACLKLGKGFDFRKFAEKICEELCSFVPKEIPFKSRVGVVGTPTALFCSDINFNLFDMIVDEGCCPVIPYLTSMFMYSLSIQDACPYFLKCLEEQCSLLPDGVCGPLKLWEVCPTLEDLQSASSCVMPAHITVGFGWSLAGQILLFWEHGIKNIIYTSTFGCLAGHVTGQGIMHRVRSLCTNINLASVEYDPGTSPVNQINRIKLLTTIAKRRKEEGERT